MGSLKGLRARYLAGFDAKIAELRSAVAAMGAGDVPTARSDLRRRLHTLAGSGEVYNLPDISSWARDALKTLDDAPAAGPAAPALLAELDGQIDVLEALVTGLKGDVVATDGSQSFPPEAVSQAPLAAADEDDTWGEPPAGAAALSSTRETPVDGATAPAEEPVLLRAAAPSGVRFPVPVTLPLPPGSEDWRVAVPLKAPSFARPVRSDTKALPSLPDEDLVEGSGSRALPAAPAEASSDVVPLTPTERGAGRTLVDPRGMAPVTAAEPAPAPAAPEPAPDATRKGDTRTLASEDLGEDEILPASRLTPEPVRTVLPTSVEAAAPEPDTAEVRAVGLEQAEFTVLVVEDDTDIPRRIRSALDASRFRVLATSRPEEAVNIARTEVPDLVVLDAEMPGQGGFRLFDRLRQDPLTSFIPILVLAEMPDFAGRTRALVAGAVDYIAKPFEDAVLARRIADRCGRILGPEDLPDLGDASLDEVVAFLQRELERGLLSSSESEPNALLKVGEGTDLLATTWTAIGRLREILARLSGGKVRYRAVEHGRLAVMAILADEHASIPPPATTGASLDLGGRRIILADDDSGVRALFARMLQEAGAVVDQAENGRVALDHARAMRPDVIVSDILMPKMDGWELCRALRRDFTLRDVPVILLSWREDFVQRMRELGSGADAYLLKESQKPVVLDRIKSVLHPRIVLEQRLSAGGEVTGRVDSVGVVTLLRATCRLRADAKVRVRENWNLFELEVRAGVPVSALCTSSDGTFRRGRDAFDELVAVDGGRFTVLPVTEGKLRESLQGSLEEQIAGAAERLGRLVSMVADAALLRVTGVTFRTEALQTYLSMAPERMREIIRRLEAGEPPRDIMDSTSVGPQEMERVLVDLVKRGAVHAILAPPPVTETSVARQLADEERWRVLAASDASDEPEILGERTASEPPPAPAEEEAPIEEEARKSLAPPPVDRGAVIPRTSFGLRVAAWATLVLLSVFGLVLWGYILFGGRVSGDAEDGRDAMEVAEESVQEALRELEPLPEREPPPMEPIAEPTGPETALPDTTEPATAAAPGESGRDERRERRPDRGVGQLSVVSTDGSAIGVIIDDRPRGTTPLTVSLPGGLHEIGLKRGEEPVIYRYVVVRDGEEVRLIAPRIP